MATMSSFCISESYIYASMAWGGVVVKALRYKSEGPGVAGIFP